MAISVLSPVSLTSFYDPYDGSVLGAKLYFYRAATMDPISVYTDPFLSVPHAQPVLTGGSGRVPLVFIGQLDAAVPANNYYRVRIFDQYDQLLEDLDYLPAAVPDAPAEEGEPEPTPVYMMHEVGDMWCAFTNGAQRVGAVRCLGGTIGKLGSGASERQNDDTYELFVWLWQQDAPTTADMQLPVLLAGAPNKGASASGDFNAGKIITLPDMRGRVPVGIDPGNATGRMTGAKFSKTTGVGSDASVPGANGGLAALTLTIEEMPVHTHTVTDPKHAHSGTTGGQSANHQHAITGSTAADGNHVHQYDRWDAGVGGVAWTYNDPPTSQRDNYGVHNTTGTGAHSHTMNFASGSENATHNHAFNTDAVATGITITHAGGKGTAPTVPASFVTQPFSLAQPFLTVCWYIHLGLPPTTPPPVGTT